MKVVEYEKVVSVLKKLEELLPSSKEGQMRAPKKFLCKENIKIVIQGFEKIAFDTEDNTA